MISFNDYQSMGQSRKAAILFSQGVALELVRETPRLKVELFSLAGFYVEIFYDRFTDDPLFLQAFDHIEGLDPYLELVSVEGAFEIKNDGLWS
jgi:hypothetical protein